MEKIYNRVNLIIILIFICFSTCGCTIKNDSVRLRIIANSNSDVDQKNKLELKDVIKDIYQENPNIDYHDLLLQLKQRINKEYIKTVKIEFRDETFPAKAYEGKFLPSGNYPTIVITIGEGKGKNFWTILYPDFFNISFEDDNEIEYRSYIYDMIVKNK